MVGRGWLTHPPRKPPSGESLSQLEQWLNSQRGLAETIGEWAFYAVVVLIALALVKSFPYHLFRKTHKWLAVAYLTLVYHTLVLTEFEYWTQPIGWVMAILLLIGTLATFLVLTGRVGRKRKVQGTIKSITTYPGVRVVEGCIQQQVRAAVPAWRSASLWFCGPIAFGRSLRNNFLGQGLPSGNYHQELFEMR